MCYLRWAARVVAVSSLQARVHECGDTDETENSRTCIESQAHEASLPTYACNVGFIGWMFVDSNCMCLALGLHWRLFGLDGHQDLVGSRMRQYHACPD